jgi:phytoene dehydrogenase-like protein
MPIFFSLGGEIVTNFRVSSLHEIPPSKVVLFDTTTKQILKIAGSKLPAHYRRRLENYKYGPGVFKIDFALSTPIPWKAPECQLAATVHLGGTLEEIADSESHIWRGQIPDRPFVLLTQPMNHARRPESIRHGLTVTCPTDRHLT